MKKKKDNIEELLKLYTIREEKSKGGIRSCPNCKSRSWWQTSMGRQCNKCWKVF